MYTNILVLDDGTEIQANKTASAITNLVYTSTVSSTTDLCPGAACAGKIEFTVWVDPGSSLVFTSGTRVQYYQEDDTGARTLVGTFWAVKPTKQSRNTYKVYAYDAVSKLDGIQSSWLRSIQSSFPMSLWAFAQAVAQQCGVMLESTALPRSGDYQVQEFYSDNLTGRQMLQWVAEASCTFLRATPDGGIEFAWYIENPVTGIFPDAVEHWVALDLSGQILTCSDGSIWTYNQNTAAYRSGGLSYEEYRTALIDKVQIKQSDDDVGVIYPPDAAGSNALVIQGNLLLTTDTAAALQPVAQAIFETMQRISYTPLKASLFSDGRVFSAGQIITATDPRGNALQTYIMTVQQQGGKISVECTGNASRDGTAAVNEKKYTNLDGKILEIKTSVDGLSVKAANLQNDYTQLYQTVDGLELTVVKDGEVRTAFAADSTSVTISSGVISFTSNSITIDSSNFKLDKSGNVTATGVFSSNNGVIGNGRNEAILTSGSLTLYRTLSNGQNTMSAQLYSEGSNAAMSHLRLLGATGTEMVTLYTDYDGSHMALRNGTGHGAITLSGATGNAEFEGNVDVQGPVGLGVTKTVSCQGLNCWDSGQKKGIVRTSFGAVGMVAFETPEPCFADSGSARLDENGLCLIVINPIYAETIDKFEALRWLITPVAEGTAWVEKRDGCALVHGTPGLTFDWLCIGAQKGYAGVYAERCYEQQPISTPDAERELDMLQDLDYENSKDLESMLDSYGCEAFPLFLKGDEPQ